MKRWRMIAIGAAVVAIAGAGATYLYLREFEPDRTRFPVRGIDVSHHQGRIDWDADDDVAFAYVKVTEGGDHRDREFTRNLAEANRLGLPVGTYHFFTFCRPAADQAKNFVEAVSADAVQLPPVVDLEFHGNCDRRPSPDEMAREVGLFLDRVEPHFGRQVIYYADDYFLGIYGAALPTRPLWRRSILEEPGHADWTIWQYDATGRVDGIGGDVDLNVLSITIEALRQLGRSG
jgi:lysozyme